MNYSCLVVMVVIPSSSSFASVSFVFFS
uniref:Uncharacterized protein n=1 Tax=Rhizophora mucronata TaxID=61149 RepID=A0A2P2P0N9_RHIMU